MSFLLGSQIVFDWTADIILYLKKFGYMLFHVQFVSDLCEGDELMSPFHHHFCKSVGHIHFRDIRGDFLGCI